MASYIALSYWDLALASVLVLIDAVLSVLFGLQIHRSLLVAAIRMAVQLTVIARLAPCGYPPKAYGNRDLTAASALG
jgi:ABC-type iron transport system FetAB permease component